MKFTRSTWVAIFVIVFMVAAVVLYLKYNSATKDRKLAQSHLDYTQQSQVNLNKTKADLAAQMTQADADVASWNSKIALLQTQLAQASLSVTQAKSQFPASAQTIEYNETLMGLAKSSNLTISTQVATEPANAQIGQSGFNFYTNVFTINVSGKVSDILGFVDKVATNPAFNTAVITPVSFNIPIPPSPEQSPTPLSQAVKDQMRADLKAKMISDTDASIQGADRVALIEKALLTLLGDSATGPNIDQMTQSIKNIITVQFGASTANLLATQIALAIENNLASTLIDTVSGIYSTAISALFTDSSGLLPQFTGPLRLGDAITAAIQGIPAEAIPGTIQTVISDALNGMVADAIASKVSDASVDAALSVNIAAMLATQQVQLDQQYQAALAAAVPSAQITVSVYSYKGG